MTREPALRSSLGIALVILAIGALGWRLTSREAPSDEAAPAQPVAAPEPALPGRPAEAVSPRQPMPVAAAASIPLAPYPEVGLTGVTRDDPLTAYRKANIYPPTSRPLSSDQVDLLRPNQRHEVMQAADHGDGVRYLFTADRYYVIGDQTLTSTLEVQRDGAPLAVTITRAFAAVLDPASHGERTIPVSFTASGAGFTHTLAPAQLGLGRQTALSMYVEFNDGIALQRAHFDFQYTPEAGVPARFTGGFHDAVEVGSLVIRVGVAVTAPGNYLIDANLFDAHDQPVAWARFKGELAAGAQDAPLVFFGKAIRDADAAGPFHLGQLRGARYAAGRDPDLEQMPPFAGSTTTKPYPSEAFSDEEWDSPDKQRMIELLSRDGRHGGAASPDPPPTQ